MSYELNPEQKKAVEHLNGPLMIIAGAGTGKTSVITRKIVHLINEAKVPPHKILALTFTEKAAYEMLERVDLEMPIGYQQPTISTFHSFCDEILKAEIAHLGMDPGYTLMTPAQSYIFFRDNLYNFSMEVLRPLGNPTKNITAVLRHFSRIQDEDVTPKEYLKHVKSEESYTKEEKAEALELATLYKEYADLKEKESRFDFADLITYTLRLFRERSDLLEKYRDRYEQILVDEFQDTNYAQNLLVDYLALGTEPSKATKKARKEANITVVGDDDQAIYKFRGAAISNIMQFKKTYPDTKQVVLKTNYRSDQGILDAAYQLITGNNPYRLEETEKIDKRLVSEADLKHPADDPVNLMVSDTGSEEADAIAKEILKLTGNLDKLRNDNEIVDRKYDSEGQGMFVDVDGKNGYKYTFSDIAILVRANSQSEEFINSLKYYGIPFKFSGPRGLYSRPEVSLLISYLQVLANYKDNLYAFNIIKMPEWNFSPRDVVEVLRESKYKKVSAIEFLEQLWGVKIGEFTDADLDAAVSNNYMAKMLSRDGLDGSKVLLRVLNQSFIDIKDGKGIGEILYVFFQSSGYLENLVGEDTYENQFKVQNISKFFNLIKSFEKDNPGASVALYVDYLQYSIEVGEVPKVEQDLLDDYDAINIMTVHGSKGLEFPAVFIVNLVSDRFPSRNRSDTFPIHPKLITEDIPDVDGTTEHLREERRLFYVAATRAKERLYLTAARSYTESGRKKRPSVFLNEILDRDISEVFESGKSAGKKKSTFKVEVSTFDDSLDISGLGIAAPQKISYSHVSTFESCPKQYKYRYILGLYGPPSATLSFGLTVHNSLKKLYDNLVSFNNSLEGTIKLATQADFIKIYKDEWISRGYDSKKHEGIRMDYGERKMKEFYKKHFDKTQQPLIIEKRFSYKMEDILVTGAIDRIDLVEEGKDGKHKVELIDYKTGKVKEQKDVDKNLQLAIYTLVAEELFGFEVVKSTLFFVEHDKKVSTSVDEDLKQEARDKIRETIKKIKEGKFEPNPGFLCRYCDYRTICEDALV